MLPRPTFGPLVRRRSRSLGRRAAPAALALLGPRDWHLGEPLDGRGYTTVFPVRHEAGSPALLKAADTGAGFAELQHEVDVRAALHSDPRLEGWTRLVPETLGIGDADGVHFVLESRLPGRDARTVPAGPARDEARRGALDAIVELQLRTAHPAPVGDDDVRRWVREPAAHVHDAVRRAHRATLRRVEAELVDALAHRRIARGWVHGDYNAANVLVDDGRISGIVDWGAAEPDGPVVLDAAMMLLWQNDVRGLELGHEVRRRLVRPGRLGDVVAQVQRRTGGDVLSSRAVLLLLWLGHVSSNLRDDPRYAANPVWMHRNVRAVLREVARDTGP